MSDFKLYSLNSSVLFYDMYKKYINEGRVMINIPNLIKGVRQVHYKKCPKIQPQIWFTEDFRNCGDTNKTIILFDTPLTIPAANYIKGKYPELRVIYWFWNHIYNPTMLSDLSPDIEKWSYDPLDCKKYGLRYNTQFYFKDYVQTAPCEVKQDFLFVGAEKGRSTAINECIEIINNCNLSKKFIVSDNTRKDRIKKWIPYDNLVRLIMESRCVVDLVPPTQKGMTLRPLEALFFNKKLITNFNGIEEMDFYCSDNIFLIGKDDPTKLKDFIQKPMRLIDKEIIDYYSFENWISRFNS